MVRTREELTEALRQLDSMIHKITSALASLRARPDPRRCKSQCTLAQRRLEALHISRELILRELPAAPDWRFRPLQEAEIPAMQALIRQRIAWMDETGLRQWNVTDYEGVYPTAYYHGCHERGELFCLADGTGRIVCVGCLKAGDDRWPDGHGASALYLHHLAADRTCKGAGAAFIRQAEAHAARTGHTFLRLDSAADNPALAAWYSALGYGEEAGRCIDGLYEGVLRQKRVGI